MTNMEQDQNTTSRKKFFLWGLGIISSITAIKLILPKKKKTTLVKMLSEDANGQATKMYLIIKK
jgi:hypothetical protein